MDAIRIPSLFSETAIRRAGDAGRNWIDGLPEHIHRLCESWQLSLDGDAMFGHLSLVLPVRRGSERLALKVVWPDPSNAHEALALASWAGQGAVQLIAEQAQDCALLLERLEGHSSLESIADPEAIVIAAKLYTRLCIAAPTGLDSQQKISRQMQQDMPRRWHDFGRPCSQRQLDKALYLSRELATATQPLLINYDLYDGNVLAGEREPWLVIDPKVIAGDKEFGFAQLLWCRLDIADLGSLAYRFNCVLDIAHLDPDKAKAWLYVRCLDYWLWALSAGLSIDPLRCEAIIDWLER